MKIMRFQHIATTLNVKVIKYSSSAKITMVKNTQPSRWFGKALFQSFVFCLLCFGITACGDPVIQDYKEDIAVQALLLVGEPIKGIMVSRTANIQDTFKLSAQAIKDADVRLNVGTKEYRLTFADDTSSGGTYLWNDTTVKVLPDTVYSLTIRLANGQLIKATTRTPRQIRWLSGKEPKPIIQYPKDTLNPPPAPDSMRIAWEPVPGVNDNYLIGILCLDTVGYGKYLEPRDTSKNRRIFSLFANSLPRYPDVLRLGYVSATNVPTVWSAFKWFGLNEVQIYAPDANWFNWYRQTYFQGQSPRYNSLLGSVEGAYGVFGSASIARQRIFVLKNAP